MIGTVVDNYEILELIGEGGMGRVYRARHRILHQDYALKVLAEELAAHRTASTRFLREAQAAAHIDHPNVVRVLYSGRIGGDGLPFLVMELLEGRPLSDRIGESGGLDPVEAAEIAAAIADGLAEIHRAGFVHRDVKPSNVMLVPGGVKILDLGLVGALEPLDPGPRLTRTGHVMGTPHYLAPEVLRGQGFSSSSDLYALGALMYEMLAGRPPFDAQATKDVLWKHLSSEPEALPPVGGLEEIALILLSKAPGRRPASAREVADRIRRLSARSPIERVVEDAPARAKRRLAGSISRAARRAADEPGRAAAGFVLVVGALLGASYGVTAVRGGPPSPAPVLAIPSPPPPADVEAPELVPVRTRAETLVVEGSRRAAENRARKQRIEPVEVLITSDPPGAAVSIPGGRLGLTPLSVPMGRERQAITVQLDGYIEKRITFRPSTRTAKVHARLEPR